MPRFITVLNSDMNKTYWKAVQWDDTLGSILDNPYYTAGVNLNLPKNGEQAIQSKVVTETSTQLHANAQVIRLSSDSANRVRLANNRASGRFMRSNNL